MTSAAWTARLPAEKSRNHGDLILEQDNDLVSIWMTICQDLASPGPAATRQPRHG